MPVLLASYKNKTAGFVLRENKKQITIGRDPGNDMPLPMSRVSRVHATLTRKNHEWFIRDLGSFNGTKINNVRVKGRSAIKPGDRLRLGNVRLQFMDTDKIPEGIKSTFLPFRHPAGPQNKAFYCALICFIDHYIMPVSGLDASA